MASDIHLPGWWSDHHESAWERIRDALRRDWEQTKNDIGGGGHDLNQGILETLRQAAGTDSIPPGNIPNFFRGPDEPVPPASAAIEPARWDHAEHAIHYGFGAAMNNDSDWNAVEGDLQQEWTSLRHEPWEHVHAHVRHGWEESRRAQMRG